MDCRKVHEIYRLYLRDLLPFTEKEWITRHVQDCPDCYLLNQQTRESFLRKHAVQAD